MSGTVKFYHPDETLVYNIEQCFCKVVYLKKQTCLVLEIISSEDLDHCEEDSLQNEFPQIIMNIDDFPINLQTKDELIDSQISIVQGTAEIQDEEGEDIEVFYTNLEVVEDDFELNNNELNFSKSKNGHLSVVWTGEVEDFITKSEDKIPFKVKCIFVNKKIEIVD
ncbi:MAG: hypothetical protein Q4F57_04125 [Weeksellaceae bacterium]|nr:hypothetical protein [Weeksellaceae bacterium]